MIEVLPEGLIYFIFGMGIVFTVLIFLWGVIDMLRYFFFTLPQKQAGRENKSKQPAQEQAENLVARQASDPIELIAVISAAAAAYLGTSTSDIVVRSIRRTGKWARN